MRHTPKLAIIVPCFNESGNIERTGNTLLLLLNEICNAGQIDRSSKLIFVDDGSDDETWVEIKKLSQFNSAVSAIKLSKNYGHQIALYAGIVQASRSYDISISIDADLQQNPETILDFIKAYKNGSDVVFGVRYNRSADNLAKKLTAKLYYTILRALGTEIIPNHADYRLLSKRAMNAVLLYKEQSPFLRGISKDIGFRSEIVKFDVTNRKIGNSKYSFSKMIKLATSGIIAFSTVPLRAITIIGLIVFFTSIIMMLYVAYCALFTGRTVPGWASTTLPIYFLSGIQILTIAVIGEYVAQIVSNTKNRPRYLIEDEIIREDI